MTFTFPRLGASILAAALMTTAIPASAVEYRVAVGDGAGGTQEALGPRLCRGAGRTVR